MPRIRPQILPGSLVLAIFVAHATSHIRLGQAPQILWMCNVGVLGIALGWLLGAPRTLATGTIWLALGTPIWVYGASTEFGFQLTSVLSHVGGLALGGLGVWRLGLPRGTWWRAALAMLPVVAVSRFLLPAHQNVNLAHRAWPGWEDVFPTHLLFLLAFYILYVAILLGLESIARRLGLPEGPREPEAPPAGSP